MSIAKVFIKFRDSCSEHRLDRHLTLGELKFRLETILGIFHDDAQVSLQRGENILCSMEGDDSKTLGWFGMEDQDTILVTSKNTNSARMIVDFNDLDAVKKYEMPDETYEKRKDSLLSFKKQNRLGRFSTDKDTQSNEDLHFTPGTPQYEHMLTLKLDHRCQVEFQKEGELARRGTIRFLGKTDFASGAWVGVEFDEPLGRNDGSVNGIRYFTCVPSYGSFVKPEFVTCGDFPEELDFSDEEL